VRIFPTVLGGSITRQSDSCVVTNANLLRWCLSLNADPNAASPFNKTVLHFAASYGNVECLELLVEAGGNFIAPSASDDVVAHAADTHYAGNDRTHIINYLLDHGADINAYYMQNRNREMHWSSKELYGEQTALHMAIGKKDKDLVQLLVQRGADITKKTHHLYQQQPVTALEYARLRGFDDIAKVMEDGRRS